MNLTEFITKLDGIYKSINESVSLIDIKAKLFGFISEVNDNIYELHNYLNYLSDSGFLEAPASTKYHGSHKYGLLQHSINVTLNLARLVDMATRNTLISEDYRSQYSVIDILLIGLSHDFCKSNLYLQNAVDKSYYYNPELTQMGHAIESLLIVDKLIPGLTDEVRHSIRWHMGYYDLAGYDETPYRNACKKYPLVYLTHTADMLSSNWVIKE
jgi:hypothetical protein